MSKLSPFLRALHGIALLSPAIALAKPTASTSQVAPSALAQSCPFDDGYASLGVEGLILTRYALGPTGAVSVLEMQKIRYNFLLNALLDRGSIDICAKSRLLA
jgi:hypothetical protein